MVQHPPANEGDVRDAGSLPGLGRSRGKETASHSSVLAWRNLWTEEPGGLQSMGSQKSQTRLSNAVIKNRENVLFLQQILAIIMAYYIKRAFMGF